MTLTPRPSQIIAAPDLGRPPELAAGLERLAPGNWWQRVRDRAADLFQAHAPEFVKELQSTTQQVDGAVAEYQRRRDHLSQLVGEAQAVSEELAAQARCHREAAVEAARRAESASDAGAEDRAAKEKADCEQQAAELDRQAAEQRQQLSQIRLNLAKADATLGRLRGQRDRLQARLRVAQARLNIEGGGHPPRRRWLFPTAVLLGLATAAGVIWLVLALSQPTGNGPGKPEALVPEEITNSIGMKLKLIKPGKFLMGSPKDEEGRQDDEGPQHEVEITKAFYIGVNPVTKGQFAAFVKDDGYQTDAEKDGQGGWGFNTTTGMWDQKPEYTWRYPGFLQGEDHPVVEVSWNDATAFCAWLSKKEGKTYELPTEAEWEYACRAGTKTRFWCGDTDASLKGNANIADASLKGKMDSEAAKNMTFGPWDDGYTFTSPVGSFKANPWGLYDMGGNVWQWCTDGYGLYQYGSIKDQKGNDSANSRVSRGGSWHLGPRFCRSANRGCQDPAKRHSPNGFRVVLRFPASQRPQQVGDVGRAVPPVAAVVGDDVTNSIGMKLKLIQPGTFTMGSPKEEEGRRDGEGALT